MNDSAFLFDTNVWMAMAFDAHPGHAAALSVFSQASKSRPAFLCRQTQLSFLRLASTPAILQAYGAGMMTNRDAAAFLERLMSVPAIAYHDEPAEIQTLWPQIGARRSASPKTWMDAWLAAFAIRAHLQLVTFDRGMNEFRPHGLDLLLLDAT